MIVFFPYNKASSNIIIPCVCMCKLHTRVGYVIHRAPMPVRSLRVASRKHILAKKCKYKSCPCSEGRLKEFLTLLRLRVLESKKIRILFFLRNPRKTHRSGESKTKASARIRRKAIHGKLNQRRYWDMKKRYYSA